MEYHTLNISQLNDFIFCPYSIYLHNVYQSLEDDNYHDTPQVKGRYAHQTVDDGTYSTKKSVITGMMVYSEKYGLIGKIDQYFLANKKLVERKRTIKTIYDGYKLQLYAQYFCLCEMGFDVQALSFHSMTDNKNYPLAMPDKEMTKWFENHLNAMRNYNPITSTLLINENKCHYCIYHPLCDKSTLC